MTDSGGSVSFSSALQALKRRGSALLVVGAVPEDAHLTASRHMLGAPAATPPRRRLVVTREGSREAARRRLRESGPTGPGYTRLLACSTGTRGASTAPSTAPDGGVAETHVDCHPRSMGTALREQLEAFERAAGSLSPGELRVGFDPTPTLVDAGGLAGAFRFLHAFGWHVRSAAGMAHVRLPRSRDASATRTLAPLFDALVELRVCEDGSLQHRWELREGVRSEWLAFS
jgi:hypothetical protein